MESLSFDDKAIDDRQRKLDYRQRDRLAWLPLIALVRVVLVDQVQNPAEVSCVVRNLVVERRQQRFRSGLISLFPVRLCPVAEDILSTVRKACCDC